MRHSITLAAFRVRAPICAVFSCTRSRARPGTRATPRKARGEELAPLPSGATPTRLPVGEGSIDTVKGVVQARDIAAALFRGEPIDLRALMRKAPVVIDQIDAMDALLALREAEVPMALIHDEYGHFEGIVTPADLLPHGRQVAESIASMAPLAVAHCIAAVNEGADLPLDRALAQEASHFGLCCATADKAEGTAAFLAKRPPAWTGK